MSDDTNGLGAVIDHWTEGTGARIVSTRTTRCQAYPPSRRTMSGPSDTSFTEAISLSTLPPPS